MTVAAATRKAGPLTGDGVNASFPFTFKVFATTDVLVVLTDLTGTENIQTLTSQYTVALNSNQDSAPGGTVTMLTPPPAGYSLTIGSQVPYSQLTVLTNTGGFFPTVINDMLDKVTALIQQLLEKVGRSLTLPISAPAGVSTQLPLPSALRLISWNANGTGLQNTDPASLGTTITATTWKVDTFVGNGVLTNFALTNSPGSTFAVIVSVGGVFQQPGTDFNISGSTLSFAVAPPNTTKITAQYGQAAASSSSPDMSLAVNTLAIAHGGTGATSQSGARTALGLGTAAQADSSAFQAALGYTAANDSAVAHLAGAETFTAKKSFAVPVDAASLGGTGTGNLTQYTGVVTPLPGAGVSFSASHSLGVIPTEAVLEMTCLTAEFGYSVGDVVTVSGQWNGSAGAQATAWKSTTQVGWVMFSGFSINFLNKSTGVNATPTAANWSYRFRLRAA